MRDAVQHGSLGGTAGLKQQVAKVQNNIHLYFVVIRVALNNDGVGMGVTLDILLDRLPDRPGAFSP